MKILETERLVLRWFCAEDAPFILELLNDPGWIRFVGDRGVRTLDDARRYIASSLVAPYARVGFGMYLVERKIDAAPIGMCGLIKRDTLEDVDIGFAFLPAARSQGLAREAARAVLSYGRETLGMKRIVAITTLDNEASIRLLESLGFRFERIITVAGDSEELRLFGSDG